MLLLWDGEASATKNGNIIKITKFVEFHFC
jgi:hypothetical protein